MWCTCSIVPTGGQREGVRTHLRSANPCPPVWSGQSSTFSECFLSSLSFRMRSLHFLFFVFLFAADKATGQVD